MVTFVASQSLDMRTFFSLTDAYPEIEYRPEPTTLTIVKAQSTFVATGNFTYDNEDELIGGTANSMQETWNGSLAWRLTGANYSISTILSFYDSSDNFDDAGFGNFAFAGNDSIVGSTGADLLIGYGGNDSISGGAGHDALYGSAGADTVSGGTGADTMLGGSGNDTYVVDNSLDWVYETTVAGGSTDAGGTDTVRSSVSHTLGSFVEKLVLTGASAINGTGNALANGLTGNALANTLNGGSGADTMLGAAGSDTYVVDNTGDRVYETTTVGGTTNAGGTDTVRSSVSYTLGSFVEKLVLTGANAINGTGNTLDNSLTGNAAASVLNGGTGADTMLGGAGNDTYYVDNLNDRVYETTIVGGTTNAGGTDTVRSSVSYTLGSFVENLTLTGVAAINGTGNALANSLAGNGAANVLRGANGNDVLAGANGADTLYGDANNDLLRGGSGNDILFGGSDNDLFRFDTALSTATVQNVDQIKDFNPIQDTIQLENSIFTKFGSTTGTVNAAYFKVNTTGLAQDSNDYLIYETETGKLFYDANGSLAGGSVQVALLSPNLALTSADYVLV